MAITSAGGVGVITALLINQHLLSPLFARTRPCHALPHVEVLLHCASDSSFPSDHCVIAGALVAGLAFIGAKWWMPAAAVQS